MFLSRDSTNKYVNVNVLSLCRLMCRCVVANFAYEVQPEVLKIFTKYFLLLHYFEDASHTVFEDTCIVEI